MNDIVKTLAEMFKNIFDRELTENDLRPDASFSGDLGMNSIGMLYMALAIEEEFGVSFNNEDFAKLLTVGDLVAHIEANRK